jgi:hypothetical protein
MRKCKRCGATWCNDDGTCCACGYDSPAEKEQRERAEKAETERNEWMATCERLTERPTRRRA